MTAQQLVQAAMVAEQAELTQVAVAVVQIIEIPQTVAAAPAL
jgi:hypothetical protein